MMLRQASVGPTEDSGLILGASLTLLPESSLVAVMAALGFLMHKDAEIREIIGGQQEGGG